MSLTSFDLALGVPLGPLGFVARSDSGDPNGALVWEYRVDPAHHNPNGVLHGGVLMALLDTAMGFEVARHARAGGKFNGVAEMSTRFLAPVREGLVRAEASIVKVGKRLAVVDGRALAPDGTLVATASATHALLTAARGQ